MKKIIIHGPAKLHGTVKVQGAKNAAMKFVLFPLLVNDSFTLQNIPHIKSIELLLGITKKQGAQCEWKNKNTLHINSLNVKTSHVITKKQFYFTSGALHAIPILVHRFGKCRVELDPKRDDTGGDQLGSRKFSLVIEAFKQLGIKTKKNKEYMAFSLASQKPFFYLVPNGSFSASVNAVISALFKEGTSEIKDFTIEAEFEDIIKFLQKMGADIYIKRKVMYIKGQKKLHGIIYKTMIDRHDFATWVSAALSTRSSITIKNVNPQNMKLESMTPTLKKLGARIKFGNNACIIDSQQVLKPAEIYAGLYPKFQTEWQVLFAPLLTQIKGTSVVYETFFSDRLHHWDELVKMGAKFKYFKDDRFPEEDEKPRAVRIFGPIKLHGAKVNAQDVRSGAALILAGLVAQGTTEICNIEHIERGYENIVGRLQELGANIEIQELV